MHRAIDIHAHVGNPDCFPQQGLEKELYRLEVPMLARAYAQQKIVAACLSPMEALFVPDAHTLLQANHQMAELTAQYPWAYQWAVVHPKYPASYEQAHQLLQNPKCVGVKIHPDAHGYTLQDCAEEIFAFCDEHHAMLQTHSGGRLSMPEVLVPFADRYPRVRVIASHLGCGDDGCIEHQVRAIQMAKHGNIFTDVSSVRSILHGIIEWAVQQVGAQKLLFGTDTPLHHIAMMKQRVEFATLSEPEKRDIFYRNAINLFQGVFEP